MSFIQYIPIEITALLAAAAMSTMSILNRRGLQTGSPYMAAVIINATVLTVYLGICTALGIRWMELPGAAVGWFLLAGISSPALSMTLYYISLSRFGVGKAGPIAMGGNPLFGVLLGILILGERPYWSLYLGAVLIIGGIWIIARPKGEPSLKWSEAVIPLAAGFFFGLSTVIRKLGLNILPLPHVGVMISSTTALVCLILTYPLFPKGKRMVRSARAVKYSLFAGVSLSISFFFLFTAINLGEVSRVMAIFGVTPLLSIMLAAIFLGNLENITSRIYGGTVSIVTGIVLIALLGG